MDITLIFFIYGLAFFSMGLAMMLESTRSPLLAQAGVLRPLAIFGLVHGSHEWLEMFLDKSEWLVFRYPEQIAWLRVGILTISFVSLIVFGLRIWDYEGEKSRQKTILQGVGLAGYTLLVLWFGVSARGTHADWLYHTDAMVRYFLAVPGAFLAGVALQRQAHRASHQDQKEIGAGLRWAGWGFVFYSLTQIVVPPLDVFPASWLNTSTLVGWIGVPVQIFRAIAATTISIGLINAIQATEKERQRQFFYIQQARLDALEQVRKELVKREAMRQELLRHTVFAQEDERARIARELHDETAQTLTAFSLHLAALRNARPGEDEYAQTVEYLQRLCRQMSSGLYRLVRDLRPAQLDDLGLVAALEYLVDEEQGRLGLQVDLKVDGKRQRLDPLVETVLFRVVQEALTNVARHAGVKQASVCLDFNPQEVRLQVCDQGVGFEFNENQVQPNGWGLAGMHERVKSIGGLLEISTAPGKGAVVEVIVPYENDKENGNEKHPPDAS
jgi:signal transduction histidine kinase